MFGILDEAIESGNYGDGSTLRISQSGYSTERFGVRGLEDLGNGMKATFWLEASLGPTQGTGGAGVTSPSVAGAAAGAAQNKTTGVTFQQWDRTATLGLASPTWGTLNVGRQYTPWFSAWARSDAYRVAGVASAYGLQLQNTRTNNMVRWDSPDWSGFVATLSYTPGDQGSAYAFLPSVGGAAATSAATGLAVLQKQSGRQEGAALYYNRGPFTAAAGYARADATAAVGAAAAIDVTTQWTVDATYDFGPAKLLGAYTRWSDSANTVKKKTYAIQLSVPVSASSVVIGGYEKLKNDVVANSDASLWGIQYAYSLSKRTTLYGQYAKLTNQAGSALSPLSGNPTLTNNAGAGFSPSVFQLGMNHTF